jgi:heat shock protein HslJ
VLRFNSDTSWQADVKYEGLPELQYFKGSYQLKNNVLTLLTDDSADFPKKFTIEGDSLIPAGFEKSSLRPIQNNLIEIQWNLKQVKGENIPDTLDPYRKPHFILGMISGRITGNGGCNGFSGYYELSGQNKIRISGVISTKMACMDIGFENDFFDVLQNADHYKIQDNFLILMKGDQILAKLTAE